jgi:Flp pilus assembly protein TadG
MIALAIAALAAVVFLGFLGRLHAAGVEVTNVAQAAARAASMETDPAAAQRAATEVLGTSALAGRCQGGGTAALAWSPSSTGEWRGGSVTVTVACRVRLQSLATLWVPGSRVVSMSDTQPVDRYQR